MPAGSFELARRRWGAVALLVCALGPGCSLTRSDVASCSSSSDCRAAFGAGHVCNSDGLCERAGANPRCSVTYPDDLLIRPENHANAILVGCLMDRSVGAQQARENAVRLAATQVTEAGGLGGRPFGVVFCDVAKNAQYDSLERTQAAVASATWLTDAVGVAAIVGPSSSTDTLEVFKVTGPREVLVISPSATSPALTGADGKNPTDAKPGLLWRTAPPDTVQGLAIAGYLMQQTPAVTGVEVIAEKGPYGEGLADVFMKEFGGPSNLRLFATSSERDDAIVGAGATPAPWVLFISSQTPDASAFLNAAVTINGYNTKNVFLTDSAASAEVLTNATAAVSIFPRVRGSRPSVPQGPVYEQFRASFNAAFKAEAANFSYVAHAYDAAWLTFFGSAWSVARDGKIHGLGIAQGLRHVSAGPPAAIKPATWPDVVKEFAAGGSVDVVGASGALDYDTLDEETRGPIDIWKIAADNQTIETETTVTP